MWKTFRGRCIYQSPQGAQVYQNFLYRWLTFGNHNIQSLIHRYHPEYGGLSYIKHMTLMVRAQPAASCLLGLGGAGIPHALKFYLGHSEIVAVENNPDVIDIANRFFMTNRLKNLSIIQQDANYFVQHCSQKFQHLMIDLYEANSFPQECSNLRFFEHCRQLLLPGGTLSLNLTHAEAQWDLFNQLKTVFSHRTVAFPVKGAANVIVLANHSKNIRPFIENLKHNASIKKLAWDPHWGYLAQI